MINKKELLVNCDCGRGYKLDLLKDDLLLITGLGMCKENSIWKKYPDEKPEEDQNCLVCCQGSDNLIHRAWYDSGFFRSLEYGPSFPLLVTHWIELPEVPK
jgi:hypothetical protein